MSIFDKLSPGNFFDKKHPPEARPEIRQFQFGDFSLNLSVTERQPGIKDIVSGRLTIDDNTVVDFAKIRAEIQSRSPGTHFDTEKKLVIFSENDLKNNKLFPLTLLEEISHSETERIVRESVATIAGLGDEEREPENLPVIFADFPAHIQQAMLENLRDFHIDPQTHLIVDDFSADSVEYDEAYRKKFKIRLLLSMANEFIAKKAAWQKVQKETGGNMGRLGRPADEITETYFLSLYRRAIDFRSVDVWGAEESAKLWNSGWEYVFGGDVGDLQFPEFFSNDERRRLEHLVDSRHDALQTGRPELAEPVVIFKK